MNNTTTTTTTNTTLSSLLAPTESEASPPLPTPVPIPPPPPPSPPPPSLTLTDEQNHAVEVICDWMSADDSCPEYKLGGYAGTGKTTAIKSIIKELSHDYHIIVSAFTGKAVHVLQRKGIAAQTLHSLMYDVKPRLDGTVEFEKRTKLKENPDLIVIDEASMISVDLYRDLLSFNLRYLFVGDPGQLEPVGDNPDLMAKPDIVLSKIHRQAEQSSIVRLATAVRTGGNIKSFPSDADVSIKDKTVRASEFVDVDQILCACNATRTSLNAKLRLHYGRHEPLVLGEKLIILRNNLQYGVFNGMIMFVDEIHSGRHSTFRTSYWDVKLHDELGRTFNLPIWQDPFVEPMFERLRGKTPVIPRVNKVPLVYATYGYVITTHKSQGSEWDHVMVFDEWMPPKVWDMKRWRYTAITRAAKKLTYCL